VSVSQIVSAVAASV